MDDLMTLDLSSAGMRAQRARIQVTAENLANSHTTGPDGPYQRKRTVLYAVPEAAAFERELSKAEGDLRNVKGLPAVHSVVVAQVESDNSDPIPIFDPSHPHADARGFVLYPDISPMREMTDLIDAQRSYEANLAVSKGTTEMLNSAIELIRR